MKKGKIAFLAGLLACSLAGVATASALIVTGASPTDPPAGQMEDVLYLAWGDTNSTGQISNITPDKPEYRVVSVAAPVKSPGAPDGKFTATLAVDPEGVEDKEHHTASVAGITVLIYDAPYNKDGTPGAGANKIAELNATDSSDYQVVSVAKTYYIKVTITEAAYSAYISPSSPTELAGTITFSYGANNA